MVGCETLTTKTNGLPATTQSVLDKTASGPGTGCASGTAPGQISTCECPGDGCQTFVCALSLPHAKTMQVANNIFVLSLFMMLDGPGRVDGNRVRCSARLGVAAEPVRETRRTETWIVAGHEALVVHCHDVIVSLGIVDYQPGGPGLVLE